MFCVGRLVKVDIQQDIACSIVLPIRVLQVHEYTDKIMGHIFFQNYSITPLLTAIPIHNSPGKGDSSGYWSKFTRIKQLFGRPEREAGA